MHNAAGRMRRLITDLLSYSRITTQAQPFEPIELARIVGDVTNDLQIAIEESGAVIEVAPMPIIEADATQMRQLFQNLFSNSLKFRKKDVPPKITVSGRLFNREDDSRQLVEHCEIVIADNGIGFDNKYADRIFAIFQRLHGKTEYDGTGIGLATVRKIVDRHAGMIEADGVPGEGATFRITLPAQQAIQEQTP
jgi:light-regulated signal transduction histidine kinase (bacteriophytochrome)